MKVFFGNQKGNIITAVLLSTLILAITSSIYTYIIGQTKSTATLLFEGTIIDLQDQMRNLLLNELAWRNTLADPNNGPQLNCIINPPNIAGNICRNSGQTIAGQLSIYSAVDSTTPFYDAKVATNGFTLDGQPCTTFPNGDCQLRIEFNLRTRCEPTGAHHPVGACGKTSLDIEVVFVLEPNERHVIRGESRSFIVNRSPSTELSHDQCYTINGRFEDADGDGDDECALTSFEDFSCPSGQKLNGFTTELEPICISI